MAKRLGRIVFTRKAAIKFAWQILVLASGTSRVGVYVMDDNTLEIVGAEVLEEETYG